MSTTTSPAPVTPPPRLGAPTPGEDPEQAEAHGRWAVTLRWAGDATSIVLLMAVLWWLAYHDGGWERTALAKVGLLAVVAVPAAASELRRVPPMVRVLIALWAVGLVASLLFAAERSGFAQPTSTYSLVPVVGLAALRIWRRRWGPPAVAGLLLVSFGLYWYQAFMDWWGQTMSPGRQPEWRPLSWHNQSGTLMVAFGLLFGGVAITGRKVVAVAFGLAAAAAWAGAWLSGSRGSIIVLILGLIVLATTAVAARGWMSGTWRTGALVIVSVALVTGLLGMAGTEAAGGDAQIGQPVTARTESAGDNFARRFLQMEAAVGMFADRPITGQGIGSYRNMSIAYMSPNSNLTNSAHNEYAEVLGEGGLLLAVPFLGLAVVALVTGLRRYRVAERGLESLDRDFGPQDLRWPLSLGAVAALAALHVHQGADFDWAYPVIPALLAIALAVTGHDTREPTYETPGRSSRAVTAVTALLLSALLLAGSVGVFWQNRSNPARSDLSAQELAKLPVPWDADRASAVAVELVNRGAYDDARWTLERAIRWNPGYHPVRVDLGIVNYQAGAISGRQLVRILRSGYLHFSSGNQVARALVERDEHDLARSVLEPLAEAYPSYETWGVEENHGATWDLLVRIAAEAGGCQPARVEAANAASALSESDEQDQLLAPIEAIVEETCR